MLTNSAIGGFLIGIVQGFGGLDHGLCLVQMMGKSARTLLLPGILWGLSHSIGVLAICTLLFVMKLYGLSMVYIAADYIFGATLIAIGAVSLLQSLWKSNHNHDHPSDTETHSEDKSPLSEMSPLVPKSNVKLLVVCWTGLIHGFSGCSCLGGVLPAFGLSSWSLLGIYAASFLLGSVIGALLFSVILGTALAQANPALREKIFLACNLGAIAVGAGLITVTALATRN